MARKSNRIPLNVFLNGKLVGQLQRETSGAIDFRYDDGWLNWENTFPVSLSLPLREDRYIGASVIAVFDNLLPDDDGIRRRVAARSKSGGTDAYSLLAAIGRDCVGALQFLPDNIDPGKAGEINSEPIDDERIADLISNLETSPLGITDNNDFRISIAGAQDKTALLRVDGQWHIPRGTTATTHILKPQIGKRDGYDLSRSVENEHFCLAILGALGLPVAKTEILDFVDTRALAIERFDRQWTKSGRLLRVPQEDCCQALSTLPTRKYQSDGGPSMADIFEFLKASDDPASDRLKFMKTQIAFWLLGATDGHAKNFSIFIAPGGGFRLTPLYDVMSAQHLLDSKQLRRNKMKLALSVGKNRHYCVHEVQPRHFKQTAAAVGFPQDVVESALHDIAESLPTAIESVRANLPEDFPVEISDSITIGALRRIETITQAKN